MNDFLKYSRHSQCIQVLLFMRNYLFNMNLIEQILNIMNTRFSLAQLRIIYLRILVESFVKGRFKYHISVVTKR